MAFGHLISFPSLRASNENRNDGPGLQPYSQMQMIHNFNHAFPENPSLLPSISRMIPAL